MHKFAALALTATVGVAAVGYTKPAEAGVYVGVGLPVPAVVAAPVVAYPPAVYAPYYYGYGAPYYYGPGFVGFGGYRGPAFGFRGPGVGFRGPGVGFRGAGFARGFRR
jgi:hypothetical protein